ncbi:MAG: ERCC4 domain-containing protein [Opitutaceae bacterium]
MEANGRSQAQAEKIDASAAEISASSADSARYFYPATDGRLLVKRKGHSIVRSASIPKPVVLVDSRERNPYPLVANHPNWIAAERRVTLKTGDYSVEGMEGILTLERKELTDLLSCIVTYRKRFIACCNRMSHFRWKAILVEATLEDIKSGWSKFNIPSEVHPNGVTGTLDAIEAKFGIPVIYTSANRDLAAERAASWLSKHFTYWWLEKNGLGRVFIDEDKL